MRNGIDRRGADVPTALRPLLAIGAACLVAALLAAPAQALTKAQREEFLPFASCPYTSAATCLQADTSGGEFVIGRKTVPISKPILLQGGLAEAGPFEQPLIAPSSGEALAKVAQEVPGGLLGIGGIGGTVTATAELAEPVSSVKINPLGLVAAYFGDAVTIALKVKLSNENLGENCYIGSDADPIVLHLTTGRTKPPEGVEPIEGAKDEHFEIRAKGAIVKITGVKLVDNTFAVPAASGCGSSLDESVLDELINLDVGLPAKAGESKAIMSGWVEQAEGAAVAKYLPKLEKEKEKKKNA